LEFFLMGISPDTLPPEPALILAVAGLYQMCRDETKTAPVCFH